MILDLFAGPGGWSEGLRMLGHRELGIEWDEAACATARAAGHERLQADVAALDPSDYPCDGLIASPPCQAWSMAGKGGGRRDVEHVVACALEIAAGNDTRADHAKNCEDARSLLVVEPLRWARALNPEWIALEQVPPVLELWTLFAQILKGWGYSTWAGVLEAERYGVPQTRERAVLMASKAGTVHPPIATHQRYVPGEPQRHDVTLEGEVLPWVSMAEALGWDDGRAYRLARGEGMLERHGERRAVPKVEPAPVITSKARTAEWVMGINNDRPERKAAGAGNKPRPVDKPAATVDSTARQALWLRANAQANAAVRPADEPAPTITGGHDTGDRVWVPTHYDPRQTGARPRPVEEPAPTMQSQGLLKGRDVWTEGDGDRRYRREVGDWTQDRPATTVACPAGHHDNHMRNAVRVTVQEASILQSFRPDYPWQGSRSKQFEQVGNAVPPLLARAVLGQLIAPAMTLEQAA